MHTTLKLLALAVALTALTGTARAQTDEERAPNLESIPGIIVVPTRPLPLPLSRPPANRPADETCPAVDLKKLDLIG